MAVLVAYARTLQVPFYLDDFSSIVENPLLRPGTPWIELWRFAPLRFVGYFTLALNERFGHLAPAGYHLVNVVIHVLGAFATYGLARALLGTPRVQTPERNAVWFPLLVALLFGLHPLQTQAVTYIVQRLAALAALFYVLGLWAFVNARLAQSARTRLAWSAACVLCGALGLISKENAATFPLALVMIEAIFFPHRWSDAFRLAAAVVAGMGLVWIAIATVFGRNPFSIAAMYPLTTDATSIPRSTYLATQVAVLWTYLRLFLWPSGLHLDWAYDRLHRWTEVTPWIALTGHLLLVGAAAALARKRPVLGFGVLFDYLAHAIESSVFPLQDMVFEHRAYLPDVGLCLVAGWLLAIELPRRLSPRVAGAVGVACVLALGTATVVRNELWRDPVRFWTSNAHLAPTRPRVWGNLGKSLIEANRPAEALEALRRSMRLQAQAGTPAPDPLDVLNLAVASQMLGRNEEALRLLRRGLEQPMVPGLRAKFYLDLGNVQFQARSFPEAEASFRRALALDPLSTPAQTNLASALAASGHLAAADSLLQVVLTAGPENLAARENLLQVRAARWLDRGDKWLRAGQRAQARRAFREARRCLDEILRLDPHSVSAQANARRIEEVIQARIAR